ncbi:unnamed protein product, partial [marine sediment metagenome]
AAVFAGKMRMTLPFGAVMGQFKMPGSFLQEGSMNNTCSHEAFKGAVDYYLIRSRRGQALQQSGLPFVVCERRVGRLKSLPWDWSGGAWQRLTGS